jgi:hypothetical protein
LPINLFDKYIEIPIKPNLPCKGGEK